MMQWLIDIVYEAVMAAIGPHNPYVDRGDPATIDYATATFTRDNAWHDLDLSAIVPPGARAVHLHAFLFSAQINSALSFRKKGNVNAINIAISRTQVANLLLEANPTVALDSNAVIQYRASIDTWTFIGLVVRGWWQ